VPEGVPEGRSGRPGSSVPARVLAFDATGSASRSDRLATEEPLEIRLLAGHSRRTAAVTMRTPGSDFELAAGFLHGEGIVAGPGDIVGMSYCTDPGIDSEQQFNIVNVALAPHANPDLAPLERHFLTTSACGVCGKASLEALRVRSAPLAGASPRIDPAMLAGLPERLRAAQGLFEVTGGLHAAGLFDAGGNLVAAREDVGRHNAVDKLLGWALMAGRLPLAESIVLVSGRASYEILQKCLAASVPVVCSVSAPSSLAVSLAEQFGMTLVGFLRGERFNIYAGAGRIARCGVQPGGQS
jgi:FdhD protein